MLNLLAASSVPNGTGHDFHEGYTSYTNGTSSTLQEIPSSYLFQRLISRPRTSVLTAGNGPANGQVGGGH
jgi:hypothetical protein